MLASFYRGLLKECLIQYNTICQSVMGYSIQNNEGSREVDFRCGNGRRYLIIFELETGIAKHCLGAKIVDTYYVVRFTYYFTL